MPPGVARGGLRTRPALARGGKPTAKAPSAAGGRRAPAADHVWLARPGLQPHHEPDQGPDEQPQNRRARGQSFSTRIVVGAGLLR